MNQMTSEEAGRIIKAYSFKPDLNEDEIALLIEALEYMLEGDCFTEEVWLFNLGHLYGRIGEYRLAVKYFMSALEYGADIAYLPLADTYFKMGEFEKAYDCYIKAAESGYEKPAAAGIRRLKQWM
ncbi:MAG: tetratricopeptide repeat protein [Erysipelotrichaceae bacterium]|nr:tetratricopeptide repeat protein [Erysipelotrichaceae bacterium]